MSAEWKKMLDDIDAPCWFLETDQRGNVTTNYPLVNCDYRCSSCGWNPKEQKRRLQQGEFVKANIRTMSETGELVLLPKGTKKLVFKKLEGRSGKP